MPYYYGFDYTYLIFCLPPLLLAMWAQAKVKSTFAQYSKVASARGMTGRDAARLILDANGLYHVPVTQMAGELTDHFDPKDNVIRLSDPVCNVRSVAAVGVAAHEAGHAVQHAVGYAPMKWRSALVPVANFGTQAAWPIILIGLLFGSSQFLLNLGILMFSLGVLFQLVTLPVEFNASGRALTILRDSGILYGEEVGKTKKVLSAAAMTYVAAAAASILSLLRLIILFGGRRDRD